MSKKLISLVLVLAFTSLAAAVQWDGGGDGTTWEDPLNWTLDRLPAETDTNAQIYFSTGATTNITISTAVEGSRKPQIKFGTNTLTINNGGSMSASGSFEQTQGTASTVNVMAGGLLDVCKKVTITTGTYKMASSGTSIDSLNIYGTVRVKNQGSLTTVASNIVVAGTATSGNGYVNIYSGGLLDVDAYTVNARGLIRIYGLDELSGVMKIKGDATAQVSADALAGRIDCVDGTLTWAYDSGTDTTTVWNVPEPATVALLGLGSLLLYRKKH